MNAGLNFPGGGAPVALTNGLVNTSEGSASIADASGNLLFYTDGITVWNKTHAVMTNGNALFGNPSSTQSGVIIQKPGSTNIYYIFTEEAQAGANGLRYSEVDMTLSAGLGAVTGLKNVLLKTPSCEKITGVRHCNNVDIWVVSHDWNTNQFSTFLVTAAGVNAVPVTSSGGLIPTGAGGAQAIGQLKASPNGKKIGSCIWDAAVNRFELFDFNCATGIISNPILLPQQAASSGAYGCEFSPDGTKFYGTEITPGNIYQWDMCAGSNAAIAASGVFIGNSSNNFNGSLQLGPDKKIYVARYNVPWVGVIPNPNVLGAGCGYIDNGVSLAGKNGSLGLPNFVTSLFITPSPPYTFTLNPASVTCLTASFTAPPGPTVSCSAISNTVTGYVWNFGNPASGALNTSTLTNPTHLYPSPGTYSTSLIINYACGTDTVKAVVTVSVCTALPIELVSFDGNCFDKNIQLNWTTASEKNNDLFILKKSTDGISFNPIAEIKGHGTSYQSNKYSFTDRRIISGVVYYYRLTQKDFDKSERILNNIVYANCEKYGSEIEIFPVPSGNEIFMLSNDDINNATIEIMDAMGRNVKQFNSVGILKNKSFSIDTDDLINGCYYISISNSEVRMQKKIIIYK